MKMSSLTDSCVFILVETQEGRKFTGKRELCDAYRSSRLFPNDSDVECLVDVDSKNVTRAPILRPPPFPHPVANPTERSSSSSPSRKRSLHVDDDVIDIVPKHAKTADSHRVFSPSLAPPPQEIPLKNERDDEVDDSEIIFLANAFDGAADNATLADVSRSTLDLQLPASSALEQSFEELFTQSDIQGVGDSLALTTSSPYSGALNADVAVDASKGLPIPPKTVEKMKALNSMNPEDVLQKDGVGAKVLNSVIYDLSKETYQLCLHLGIESPKDFRSKQLLMDNFEKWFSKNLRHIVHSPIVVKTGRDNSSAIAYCKSIARKYLYSAYKGRNKMS